MDYGFARVAAASVRVHLGNVDKNRQEILKAMEALQGMGVRAAVFPEMCLTGYTLGDMLTHRTVQSAALEAMLDIASKTGDMAVIVGLPLSDRARLYNCAAVLMGGKVRGIVPKTYLPNGVEFYETRWFESGARVDEPLDFGAAGRCRLLAGQGFDMGAFTFAVEICEDLWTPAPPSSGYAVSGADVIFNPSASNTLVSKHEYRRSLLMQQSARLYAGYAYACAGFGESTSDLVFCGYTGVYENGRALSEGPRFSKSGGQAVADIDIARLHYQRQRNGSFFQTGCRVESPFPICGMPRTEPASPPFMRPIEISPFAPDGPARLDEITEIQVTGLVTRLCATGIERLVIGVSGGLDSTLALLVAARAMDDMRLPRENIHAITMPGMGTGKRTKGNAHRLMAGLHVTALEIPIEKAVMQHFEDIGQDAGEHDVTYENSQARERTQILMDYANKIGGLVLGTGDMSELALGYATYNGDHMSMYNVNCSVPKTLIKLLVTRMSESIGGDVELSCRDVVSTPISPELLPTENGELSQKTESIIGDYALNDFFLYHLLDSGSSPARLFAMAKQAFCGVYGEDVIKKQLKLFLRRFFSQQFKRNCVPDGPKVGSISLSPRGDLRMPSDMESALWLEETDKL